MVTDIWELDRFDYSWLTDEHPSLRRNYTANDIEEEIKETPVKYGVFVEKNEQTTKYSLIFFFIPFS